MKQAARGGGAMWHESAATRAKYAGAAANALSSAPSRRPNHLLRPVIGVAGKRRIDSSMPPDAHYACGPVKLMAKTARRPRIVASRR